MDRVKKKMCEIYDASAQGYGRQYKDLKAGRFFMKKKIETALAMAQFKKGDRILEVGCANGCYTFEFAQKGFDITGMDLSPACISLARQKNSFPNVHFEEGDVEKMQFADNSFDGVISFSTFRYLANPDKALAEIYRITKHGGLAVVDFPNRANPWFNYLKPAITGITHPYDHHYKQNDVKEMLFKAGFNDVEIRTILFTPKTVPDKWFFVFEIIEFISSFPFFRNMGAIIMARGVK